MQKSKIQLTQLSTFPANSTSSSCNLGPTSSANSSASCRVLVHWATGITARSPARYRSSVRCKSGTGGGGSSCGKERKVRPRAKDGVSERSDYCESWEVGLLVCEGVIRGFFQEDQCILGLCVGLHIWCMNICVLAFS